MTTKTEEAFNPKNELEIAEGIRDGKVSGPVHLKTYSLFDMRITGTGAAYRLGKDEHVWRDPAYYLNDRFLQRCNGLIVIWEHPSKGGVDHDEYHDRGVGMIVLPYIKGEEVWGIARIYDRPAIEMLVNEGMSTSPMVVLGDAEENRKITFDGDGKLLIEGDPPFLDHLAICDVGVWDKMETPSGIGATQETDSMTDEEKKAAEEKDRADKAKADAEKEKADKAKADAEPPAWAADMMDRMDAMGKRMDSMEAGKRSDSDESEEDKKKREEAEKADKAKADAEEKEKADSARRDADEKERKDAKARMDAIENAVKERSDEEVAELADAQARCDSVASAFGKSARQPMAGEKGVDYRRRMATEYKAHSPRWKEIDLAALPGAALANAERDIYADAMVAARAPGTAPAGTLREIKVPRAGGMGHMAEFIGDPDSWMMMFKPPLRARVREGGLGIKRQGA